MDDLTKFWQQIQNELRLRMTQSTYDTVIQPTRAVSLVGSLLTVYSPAKDWLENQLGPMIARVASDRIGQAVRVVYVNGLPPMKHEEPLPLAEIEDLPPVFDPRKRAWAKHPLVVSRIYPAYFVRAAGRVVGSVCVPFWRHLCDRFDMSRSDHLDWTPSAPYILGRLAVSLGCPVTHLSGRLRTCHHFDKALLETGELIPCCGRFRGAQMGQTQQGRPACHYRVAGALEVLAGVRWIAAHRPGADARTFKIQALRFPPLPTPAQMELLPELQEEYYQFLRDYGHDLDEWRQGRLSRTGREGLTETYTDTYSANWQSNSEGDFFLASNWSQQAE